MNKRAELGDQLYIAYFIFILLMITGGIVLGSYLTSGKDYDLRGADSEILMKKVADCLSSTQELTEKNISDLYSTCDLSENALSNGLIIGISSDQKSLFNYGNVVACGLSDKNENYPKCSFSTVRARMNGVESDLYLTTGSDLKSEKKK